MFSQGQFINSASATPEEIARKRAEIAAMMPRFGSAEYVGEGLGQLFMGIGLGRQQKALDGQEREGRAAAQDRLNAVFGGGLTGRARPGDFTVLGPSGTFIAAPPPPKPTESFMGMPDMPSGNLSFGLPKAEAPAPSAPLSFGSAVMTPQEMLIAGAKARGLDPIDVATAISYETGGKFDPMIQGPTTQWGTHQGLIQFGEPQAAEHGVDFSSPDAAWRSQLDPNTGAVWSYLDSTGVQPGMGLDQIYSAINAGGVNRFGASDAHNGGAPGTVADKVAGMGPHRENAAKFLGGTWVPDPNGGQPVNVNSPQMTAATMPTDALMSLIMDPWQPPEVRAMAQTMLQEQQRMNDPAYTMGLREDELAIQKAEAELEAMRNPTPKPIEVGGVLLDPVTFQPIFDSRQGGAADLPADFQSLKLRAEAAGLQPGTPEYQSFMMQGANGGAPAAFVALDMQAQAAGFEPGTPEYKEFMATRGAGLQAQAKVEGEAAGEAVTGLGGAVAKAQRAIDLIDEIAKDPALPSITGMLKGMLPPALAGGQSGVDLNAKILQLQGTAFLEAFESLKGGGAITEIEGTKAEQAIARLQRAQSTEAYQAALSDLRGVIESGMNRAKEKAAKAGGEGGTSTGGKTRLRFNPETGGLEAVQ